jgi:hypothetical protein
MCVSRNPCGINVEPSAKMTHIPHPYVLSWRHFSQFLMKLIMLVYLGLPGSDGLAMGSKSSNEIRSAEKTVLVLPYKYK